MLGCSDSETASFYSERAGDMSIQINTTMTVRQTMAVAQVIPQYRHTEGQGRRKLLTPDEVLRLPNEELLCVIRGQNVLKLNKFDFTKHPMSKKIRRVSIMDYNPAAFPHTDFYKPPATDTQSPAEMILPEKTEENQPNSRPSSRRKLYSSATPPSEF